MTVLRISLAGLVRARRTLAIALLPAAALLVAFLLTHARHPDRAYAVYTERLVLPIVTALVGLVLGASTLGEERDEQTILYLAQTPVARIRIVLGAWAAAWAVTAALLVPALVGGAWLASRADLPAGSALAWLVVAIVIASGAYTALATVLSLITRRAVIAGMLYIVLWEGSVASFAPSADRLSVAAYARRLAVEGSSAIERYQVPDVPLLAALLVPIVAAALALAFGARRLSRMELP